MLRLRNFYIRLCVVTCAFMLSAICIALAAGTQPPSTGQSTPPPNIHLSLEDQEYLSYVYQDTWNYLATFVEPLTGMPYDSNRRQPATSISNVGLYLSAASIAYQTDLISREEAVSRIGQTLDSLFKIETWRGFPRVWVAARSLKPIHGTEEFSYSKHIANLIGGLILVQNIFPEEFGDDIKKYMGKMDFKSMHDPKTGWVKGGYDVSIDDYAVWQPIGPWHYKFIASEARLISFYLVASKAAPPSHWDSLVKTVQKDQDEWFFVSSYEDGGAYMPYMASLFLDERHTLMGASQKNYSRSQMKLAQKVGAPVWGWSASLDTKGEYVPYGQLKDEIVSPYASILALIHYPTEVIQNLRKLEELGARPSAEVKYIRPVPAAFLSERNTLKPWAVVNNKEVYFINKFNGLERLTTYINPPEKTNDPLAQELDLVSFEKLIAAIGHELGKNPDTGQIIRDVIRQTNIKPGIPQTLIQPSMYGDLLGLASKLNLYQPANFAYEYVTSAPVVFTGQAGSFKPWAIATNGDIFFISKSGTVERLSHYVNFKGRAKSTRNYDQDALEKILMAAGEMTQEEKLEEVVKQVVPGTFLSETLKDQLSDPSLLDELLSLRISAKDARFANHIKLTNGRILPTLFLKEGSIHIPWAIQTEKDIFFIDEEGNVEKLSDYIDASPKEEPMKGCDEQNLRKLFEAAGYPLKEGKKFCDFVESIKPESVFKKELAQTLIHPNLVKNLQSLTAHDRLGVPGEIKYRMPAIAFGAFEIEEQTLKPWAIANREEVFFINNEGAVEKLSDYLDTTNVGEKIKSYHRETLLTLVDALGYDLKKGESVQKLIKEITHGATIQENLLDALIDPVMIPELMTLVARTGTYAPDTIGFRDIKLEHYGFRDAIDWKSGRVEKLYLTPSQGMAFLAIANVLHDGIVWKTFAENAKVATGLSILKNASEEAPLLNTQAQLCQCEISLN